KTVESKDQPRFRSRDSWKCTHAKQEFVEHFVRNDRECVMACNFCQLIQLLLVGNHPRGIMRGNQNDGACALRDLLFQVLEVDCPVPRFREPVMPHLHTAQASDVVKERIRRLRTEDLVTRLREKL